MKILALSNVAEIIAGQSPDSSTYNTDGEGLPFFQGKADFKEKFPEVRIWCNSEKRKEAKPGDILMSVRAPVGSVNICDQQSIIGRGLSAIRPMQGVNADYLYFFFKVNEEKIASLGTGSTFKAITQEVLKKVKIPLPPLEDQIRIAHLLGKVESLIAQRKKDIEQLDQLLKSVFLEMFGDPVRNEKGWEKISLSKITEQVVDCPHSTPKWTDKGIICLRTSNLGHGAWNWDDTRYVDETQYQQRISRSEIVPGDIILSREGTVGVLALVPVGV